MKQTRKQQLLYSTILHKIYTKCAISRTDIAKSTGITTATVSLISAEMLSDGVIQEVGEDESDSEKVGRKKILLSVRPQYSYYIGAEVSEKFFSFVLTDNTGIIIEKKCIYHSDKKVVSEEEFLQALTEFADNAGQKVPKIEAVGIALPGHYSDTGSSRIITNNEYWKEFDLDKISRKTDIPVFFSNNVHCMARAESLFYAEPSEDNSGSFMFFHFGRGIHCAQMYHDALYSRGNLNIGEIGHIIYQPGGELCECGKRGCLQTFASEAWLTRKARILYRASGRTALKYFADSEEEIGLLALLSAYELGDKAVVSLIDQAVESIRITIENLNMIIDASRVFVHGEIFNNKSVSSLLKSGIELKRELFETPQPRKLIIKPYTPYTGAVGAAALCVYRSLLGKE